MQIMNRAALWQRSMLAGSAAAFSLALPAHAQAQSTPAPSGADIYRQRCAMCHDNPSGSIPAAGALRTRAADYVLRVLEGGVMRPMAQGLTPAEKQAVAEHVTAKKLSAATIDLNANRCAKPAGPLALGGSAWNGWAGAGLRNARYQAAPGIAAGDVGRLKLKWAFALPGGTAGAQAQPTVVGDRVFLPSASGAVFALDAKSGCTLWVHDLGVPVRNAMTVAVLPKGGAALLFGDDRGDFHALNAATGKEIWHTRVDSHPAIRLTGSAVLFENRLYVPVSSLEEAAAGDPPYKCCTFRGSLVALDAITG
jgi:polyvinyl alcohol dehydrogenase (cytochrome)